MIRLLETILARLRLPRPAPPPRRPTQAVPPPSDEPHRDASGYYDPGLGDLKDDWDFVCWRGRMVFDSGDDCDLTLLEREEDGFPDSDPRPSGLARLRGARLCAETELAPRAIRAVIEARMARLNWRDGPPEERWGPVEMLVDRDDTLWLSVHEGETDEYSLWIVRFDPGNRPTEVRRAPFVASPEPAFRRARIV